MPIRNVFAVLVHERPECAVDLVRNLRHLDPGSQVLLYNGGKNAGLLDGVPFERLGAVIHPNPRRMEWGKLHGFALDCLRFALDRMPFDTLTIVDSDQLAARPGYSEYLGSFLEEHPRAGVLGNAPFRQPVEGKIGPAAAAYREFDLWRPWLKRFPDGEEKYVHWTFWPSTVFTANAARDLIRLFDEDKQLQEILRKSQIWATEEVLFPTLAALLGYEVLANPCSYDYVQFRQAFTREEMEEALARPDVFWIHPVPRRHDDALRKQVRERHGHYGQEGATRVENPGILTTLPILERIRKIPGWLEDEEADLLLAASARALADLPEPHSVVEVGSYCGRSTVVLGSAVKALRPSGRVVAIDPHLGQVGALDQGLQTGTPTYDKLRANLAGNGLSDHVEIVRKCSFEVEWSGPIGFLLIDGLHDYMNVARDFLHFESSVATGGYVAFHDYAEYYPGVRAFVDELLASGSYQKVHQAKSLVVVRKLKAAEIRPAAAVRAAEPAVPLVSCIMPTCDRRAFVPQAIRQFLRQDWPNAELIVIDDGTDRVADLIPEDPRIRYIAVEGRRTVGAKRNLACEAARGEIILHWDDDDWMAEWRIRYQVEQLLAAKADICGLPRIYFHEPAAGKTWEFTSPARDRRWIAGATFCYRKDLWRAGPFEDVDIGEDMRFLWSDRRKKVAQLDDPSFYVARLHSGNTSSKRDGSRNWRPVSDRVLARLLDGVEAVEPQLAPIVAAASAPVLVSCVMPTRDRRELALQAIQYFLRQDYPERELVIVDDGAEPLPVPEDQRIRYIRVPGPVSLGAKRNLGVEQSRGEFIIHWDDDDWYAPDRIRYQVEPLLAGEADISGLAAEHFYSLRGGTFWTCSPRLHARMFFADVHGRSVAYARRVWGRQAQYPDLDQGEDARFLQAALRRGSRLARQANPDKFVYVRHGANTWQFECGEFLQPADWKAREQAPAFLPEGDLAFYRGLALHG